MNAIMWSDGLTLHDDYDFLHKKNRSSSKLSICITYLRQRIGRS